MHAAPRTSLLLSQALQALPLGHPHRVSKEDGKWVREGCFSIEKSTRASTQLWFSPCSQCAVCPLACTAAAAAAAATAKSGLEFTNLSPTEPARTGLKLEN